MRDYLMLFTGLLTVVLKCSMLEYCQAHQEYPLVPEARNDDNNPSYTREIATNDKEASGTTESPVFNENDLPVNEKGDHRKSHYARRRAPKSGHRNHRLYRKHSIKNAVSESSSDKTSPNDQKVFRVKKTVELLIDSPPRTTKDLSTTSNTSINSDDISIDSATPPPTVYSETSGSHDAETGERDTSDIATKSTVELNEPSLTPVLPSASDVVNEDNFPEYEEGPYYDIEDDYESNGRSTHEGTPDFSAVNSVSEPSNTVNNGMDYDHGSHNVGSFETHIDDALHHPRENPRERWSHEAVDMKHLSKDDSHDGVVHHKETSHHNEPRPDYASDSELKRPNEPNDFNGSMRYHHAVPHSELPFETEETVDEFPSPRDHVLYNGDEDLNLGNYTHKRTNHRAPEADYTYNTPPSDRSTDSNDNREDGYMPVSTQLLEKESTVVGSDDVDDDIYSDPDDTEIMEVIKSSNVNSEDNAENALETDDLEDMGLTDSDEVSEGSSPRNLRSKWSKGRKSASKKSKSKNDKKSKKAALKAKEKAAKKAKRKSAAAAKKASKKAKIASKKAKRASKKAEKDRKKKERKAKAAAKKAEAVTLVTSDTVSNTDYDAQMPLEKGADTSNGTTVDETPSSGTYSFGSDGTLSKPLSTNDIPYSTTSNYAYVKDTPSSNYWKPSNPTTDDDATKENEKETNNLNNPATDENAAAITTEVPLTDDKSKTDATTATNSTLDTDAESEDNEEASDEDMGDDGEDEEADGEYNLEDGEDVESTTF